MRIVPPKNTYWHTYWHLSTIIDDENTHIVIWSHIKEEYLCNEPGKEGGLKPMKTDDVYLLYLSHKPQTQSIKEEYLISFVLKTIAKMESQETCLIQEYYFIIIWCKMRKI